LYFIKESEKVNDDIVISMSCHVQGDNIFSYSSLSQSFKRKVLIMCFDVQLAVVQIYDNKKPEQRLDHHKTGLFSSLDDVLLQK